MNIITCEYSFFSLWLLSKCSFNINIFKKHHFVSTFLCPATDIVPIKLTFNFLSRKKYLHVDKRVMFHVLWCLLFSYNFFCGSYIFLYCQVACLFNLLKNYKKKKKGKNDVYRKVAKAVQKKSFSEPFLNSSLDASLPPHTLVFVSCKFILLQIHNTAFKSRELTLRHQYQLILRHCSCYSHNILCSKNIHFGITFCIECHVSLRFF